MKLFFRLIYSDKLLFLLTFCISLSYFCYFFLHGQQNLSYNDALSRLNIARRVTDSITPGVGQLGAIWLPFPSVLMIPFTLSNFLWHSGTAGAIISESAFVLGAVYLKKTAYLITKNIAASLIVWAIFVSNINVLLFQTMAMSESFFLYTLIMSLYFLTKWIVDQKIINFLSAAFFVMLGTLTRYEGYFMLVGSMVTIGAYLVMRNWRKKNFSKIEGMLLLFLFVASYGIFLWCLYCLLFFKNPLYWLTLYSGNTGTIVPSASSQRNLLDSMLIYSYTTVWMNGVFVTLFGILGYLVVCFYVIKSLYKKHNVSNYLPLVIVSTIMFILLIYGYQKGYIPPVDLPGFDLQHFLNKKYDFFLPDRTSNIPNIRYGLEMLPFIAIFVGVLVARVKFIYILVILLIGFQVYTNYQTSLLLQFSIPYAARYNELPSAHWLKSNYTNGYILISDSSNQDFIFETGLPYNRFIYEGTRQYWKRSLSNPSEFSSWVVYQTKYPGDLVYENMSTKGKRILKKDFKLVYSDKKEYYIYHIVNK